MEHRCWMPLPSGLGIQQLLGAARHKWLAYGFDIRLKGSTDPHEALEAVVCLDSINRQGAIRVSQRDVVLTFVFYNCRASVIGNRGIFAV